MVLSSVSGTIEIGGRRLPREAVQACAPHLVIIDTEPQHLLCVECRFESGGACGEFGGQRQEGVFAPGESAVGTEAQRGPAVGVQSDEQESAVIAQQGGLCECRHTIGALAVGEQTFPTEAIVCTGVDIAFPHTGHVVFPPVEGDFGQVAVGLGRLHAEGFLGVGKFGGVFCGHTVGLPTAVHLDARQGAAEYKALPAGAPRRLEIGGGEVLRRLGVVGGAGPRDGIARFAVHAHFDAVGALRRAVGRLHHHGGVSVEIGGESALFARLGNEVRSPVLAQSGPAACTHHDTFHFGEVGVRRERVNIVDDAPLLIDGEAIEFAFHLDCGHAVAPVVFRAKVDLAFELSDFETRGDTVGRNVFGFRVVVQARGQCAGGQEQHSSARKQRERV